MESTRIKLPGKITSLVFGSLAILLATGQANALTGTWICGSGAWEDPSCWSYSGWGSDDPDITPDWMYEALLLSSDDIDRTITISSYNNYDLSNSTIDATGSGTMTLVQNGGHWGAVVFQVPVLVGVSGTGTLIQTGGKIGGELRLGVNAGSSGRYELTGGGISSEWSLTAGERGNGLVNQSGGHVSVGSLVLGFYTGASGTYNLTNGSLGMGYNAQGDISWIGWAGSGTLNQSGGSHSAATGFVIGAKETGQGTYNLSGGSASADQFLTVGDEGTGTLVQTGGVVRITGGGISDYYTRSGMQLGYRQHGLGTYDLIDGTVGSSGGGDYINVEIGNEGTGVFNQSGGLLDPTFCLEPEACGYYSRYLSNANGTVNIAKQTGSTGTYNMSGGRAITNGVNVGIGGQGRFNQSGGSQVIKGTLEVADDTAGGSGVYTLSGGTLDAQAIVVNQNGSFNYDGGSVITDQFTNGGKVALHNPAADTLIDGSYTQLAAGILQLEGEWSLLDGLDYTRLDICNTALLGGTLDFSLDFDLGGYTPDWSNGDPLGLSILQFDLFSADTILGEFDVVELPDLGDLDPFYDWKVSYLLNDFDTDYVRLSMVYTGGTAVPEPSTLLLLIPGLATIGFGRKGVEVL